MEFLGTYEVEKAQDEQKEKWAYCLHGPKVDYYLIRAKNGEMYALNSRLNICSIKGNYWFSDVKGQLIPLS